jgi:hypothetical protein
MIVGEAFWSLANATPPTTLTGDRVFMVAAILILWVYMALAPRRRTAEA